MFSSHSSSFWAPSSALLPSRRTTTGTLTPTSITVVETKMKIFNSLIQSHLTQNLIAFGRSNKSNMKKLQKLQDRALRVATGLKYRDDCSTMRVNKRILTIENHYKLLNCLWVIKCLQNRAPYTLIQNLIKNHNWERTFKFRVPKMLKSEKANRLSPLRSMVKEWNNLEDDIRIKLALECNTLPYLINPKKARYELKMYFISKQCK